MTAKTKLVFSIVGLSALVATALATPAHRFGTDIFHFFVRSALVNQGIEPDARGSVAGLHNVQGQANTQKFDVQASGLSPNTPYELDATVDGDTNFFAVTGFTTDANGRAALHYQRLGNGQGNGPANGHGKLPLPGSLDPVNMITGVAIVNTNLQPVLAADLMTPDQLQVLIKRDLSTADVSALLFIHANDNGASIRLAAGGLATNSVYGLALNGNIVQTNSSDAHGRLSISTTLANPEVLQLNSVTLVDSTGTNVVVGTSLP